MVGAVTTVQLHDISKDAPTTLEQAVIAMRASGVTRLRVGEVEIELGPPPAPAASDASAEVAPAKVEKRGDDGLTPGEAELLYMSSPPR